MISDYYLSSSVRRPLSVIQYPPSIFPPPQLVSSSLARPPPNNFAALAPSPPSTLPSRGIVISNVAGRHELSSTPLADRLVGMRRISPQLLAAAPPFLARQASNPLALRRRLRNKVQLRELSGLPRPQWKRHALRHTPQSLAPVRSHNHVSTTATAAAAATTTTRKPQSPLLLHGRSRGSILAPGILSRADSAVLYSSSSSSSSSSSTPSGDGTPTRSAILACPEFDPSTLPKLPFRFETGVALFAKRAPRPFPPPFLSPPSGSFSDPLSTHHHGPDKRATFVDGRLIQGVTNGDDAVFASDYFVCANDGVGAWSTRPRGHAG